jgi:gas vesicle protein
MNDNDKLTFVGLAAGLTVGLTLGILFAPRPGKEIREKIGDRINWALWSPKEKYAYLWKRTCKT